MATKKFTREFILEEAEEISDEITGQRRWMTEHWMLFKDTDGLVYGVGYERGSTEMQDDGAQFDEDNSGLIECTQYHEVEKVLKVWEQVP